MIRLHFVVEGDTEETFVRNVLAVHFGSFQIIADARRVEFSRNKGKINRGGLLDYDKLHKDLVMWLKEDNNPDARFTTMVDLYALPTNFPGYTNAKRMSDPYKRVAFLEEALKNEIDDTRLVPYIQLHEFEALLFADVQQFDWEFLDHESEINQLAIIPGQFDSNPELINDSPMSAPSKRIIQIIGEYERRKASSGPLIAEKIGLQMLRTRCQHFDEWVSKLEQLS